MLRLLLLLGAILLVPSLATADAPPFVPCSWTLVILPDTQYYSKSHPDIYTSQTQWIRDNVTARNIKYVIHEGDVTDNNSDAQWLNAVSSMSLLDGAVPYAMVPGNHDVSGNRVSQLSERFLSRTRSMATFGDTYEHDGTPPDYTNPNDDLNNSYHLFSAGGQDWIVICLEWAPRDAVLGWANQLLDTYSGRTAMIVTHAYLNNDDTRYDWWLKGTNQQYNPHSYDSGQLLGGVNDGEEIWRNLIDTCDSSYLDTCSPPHAQCDPTDPHNVWTGCDPAKPSYLHPHENVLFVLNGHVLGDGAGRLSSTTGRGNMVHQILANYQALQPNGGNGYLRLLEFRPDGTVQVYAYSPYLDARLTDDQQQFMLPSPIPAAPTGSGSTDQTPTSMRFTWQDNANNETGFKIYYDLGSGEPATLQATTAANATYYDAAGLSSGSEYSFQVQAISGNFNGARSPLLVTETLPANGINAPLITQQPATQPFCPGGSAVFNVSADGTGPLSYRWQKNSADLPDGGHCSGVTTSSLTMSNLDSSDWADYRCLVTNSGGTVISDDAHLAVVPAPAAPANAGDVGTTSSITWYWSDVSGETGYRLKDASGVSVSGDLPANTTQWVESGLTPNAPYTRRVHAFAGCMESLGSTVRTRYPLAKAGISTDGTGATGNVWCATASVGGYYGLAKTFTFSNPAGFGISTPGGSEWRATGSEYKWNKSATETWGGSGSSWSSGTKNLTPNAGEGDYYLHVRAKNGNQNWNNNDVADYGPFHVDGTAPASSCEPLSGVYDGSVSVSLSASEPAVVYYTTDGGEPTPSSAIYSTPLLLSSDTVLRFYAVDAAGNAESPKQSVSYRVLSDSGRIAAVKRLGADSPVSLGSKYLHKKSGTFGYIEEPDRTAGIRVEGSITAAQNSVVSLLGSLRKPVGSECYILLDTITPAGSVDVRPLGANNATAVLAMLTGVRVKTWGMVHPGSITANSFTLDDGSTGTGIAVITDAPPGVSEGEFVVVTGAMGFAGSPVVYAVQVQGL